MTTENHSARRINRIAKRLGAKTYLEIGVARGTTFFSVKIDQKTGVDPKFRIPGNLRKFGGHSLIETTSDEYFESLPYSVKFDIIYIDGLHKSDQAMRDFMNAVKHSHEKTVILIDDTIPCDAHSVLTTQEEAVSSRAAAGGKGMEWHGDVFKVPLLMRHEFPQFSYVTAMTGGNPQTIAWFDGGAQMPRMTVEQIMAMGYSDFLTVQDQFNPMSEEAAIDSVLGSLCG